MSYLYLAIAIACEVIATSALKASQGFTVPIPSIITVVGYAIAFYLLSLTLKQFQSESPMPFGRVQVLF